LEGRAIIKNKFKQYRCKRSNVDSDFSAASALQKFEVKELNTQKSSEGRHLNKTNTLGF
jgi:hypothetical protein